MPPGLFRMPPERLNGDRRNIRNSRSLLDDFLSNSSEIRNRFRLIGDHVFRIIRGRFRKASMIPQKDLCPFSRIAEIGRWLKGWNLLILIDDGRSVSFLTQSIYDDEKRTP